MRENARSLKWMVLLCVQFFGPHSAHAQASPRSSVRVQSSDLPAVKRLANFILSLQNAGGAIQDEPGVKVVNQDSNMEYALIGLGAAYAATKEEKYLKGLENGIQWLADREEMSDPGWKGSWRYVYSPDPPYNPVPTSPEDPKITDVRGVDATSTLFVYLLHLHKQLTGNDALARKYAVNAQAALDFVVDHNLDQDGFSWSSWQVHADDGKWHLYQFKFSADQGDVYLGMQAGAELYKSPRYASIAAFLKRQTPTKFFSPGDRRYAMGLRHDGTIDPTPYVFAQGYLSWMWGDTKENLAALDWLQAKVRADGSIIDKPGETPSSLSVAVLGMASAAAKKPVPIKSFQWLITTPIDPKTGGVHENLTPNSHLYDNVAGFCVIALTGFLPFDQPAKNSGE
jgi:virulence-associated protein VapD